MVVGERGAGVRTWKARGTARRTRHYPAGESPVVMMMETVQLHPPRQGTSDAGF